MTWARSRLKFRAELPVANGLGLPGAFNNPEWPRYVRTTDIDTPRTLREDVFASLPPDVARPAMLRSGDLLMTAAGATIGKSLLFEEDYPACYAGFLVRFRADGDTDPRFISYWTQSAPYWAQIEMGAVRSTIDNFSASKYGNLFLDIPALEVQQRIADFLDDQVTRIDQIVDARQRQLGLLPELVRVGLRDLYRVDPTPDYLVGRVGESCSIRRLGVRSIPGGTPDSNNPEFWADHGEGTPWISISDMVEGGRISATQKDVTVQGLAAARLSATWPPTVLFAMYASLGKSSISDLPAVWNQAILGMVPGNAVEAKYLLGWFELIKPSLPALARSSTQDNFNGEQVMALRIPPRSLEQQRQIARQRDRLQADLMRQRGLLTSGMELLRELKRSLISSAVSGEFDVSSADGSGVPV